MQIIENINKYPVHPMRVSSVSMRGSIFKVSCPLCRNPCSGFDKGSQNAVSHKNNLQQILTQKSEESSDAEAFKLGIFLVNPSFLVSVLGKFTLKTITKAILSISARK